MLMVIYNFLWPFKSRFIVAYFACIKGIHDERKRRQEEKAAKEVAAEERRKVLEAERQLHIQKMREARREREERVGKMQLEREKERQVSIFILYIYMSC